MKPKQLWKLSIETSPEAEEAVTELLQNRFGQPASSYTDVERGMTIVMQLFAIAPEEFRRERVQLREALKQIQDCGLNVGPGAISLRKIRNEDWANSWKHHFKPIEIGAALLIKTPWSKRRARPGQKVIVLNPGLSFGTGQHPTTCFCLRQIIARRDEERRQSFLDIGTGSGILAIAAAKLGYSPVHAFDFDADAVRIARANATKNRVSGQTRFRQADLTRLSSASTGKYDVICANLISTPLIDQRRRILSRLARGGVLVLAGILKSEFPSVRRTYEREGLKLIAEWSETEWHSGVFLH